jgi:hypothetical protein
MTREQWLGAGIVELRPLFVGVNYPLPAVVHASIGFPSRGAVSARSRVLGQCWAADASKDGNAQIFVSPVHATPVEVLDTLAHELVHVVTPGAKHRGKFITVSRAVGLTEGKPSSAAAGAELRVRLEEIAHRLGDLPHPALSIGLRLTKQSTRMVKCECPDCGYTARTTRKWLEIGPPVCPACRVQTEVVETVGRLNGRESV